MLSRFHLIPERYGQTDGRTDRQMDRIAISISRVSVLTLTRVKNLAATHSLTHCCAWPAEGCSVLHTERSWPAIQAAPTDRPMSSSTCCSQFLRGRPGGRFQSAAGGVPVSASYNSCSACEAGVFSGRRQMWPENEWRLSAIRDVW